MTEQNSQEPLPGDVHGGETFNGLCRRLAEIDEEFKKAMSESNLDEIERLTEERRLTNDEFKKLKALKQ